MKQNFLSTESKSKYILQWILIYIFVMAVCFLLSYAATWAQNKYILPIIKYDYEYYQKEGTFNPNVAVNGANNFLYDKDGILVDSIITEDLSKQWYHHVDSMVSKLLSKESFYQIAVTNDINNPVAIIAGFKLENGDIFIFLRMQKTFYKNLSIIAFTSAVLIFTVAMYFYKTVKMKEKVNKMQRNYVDNITHELKTPIASVRALTETLYDGLIKTDDARTQYYEIILNEIDGLENTVTNMLELSKIQNNQIDCTKQQHSFHDVFLSVIEKYAELCYKKGINFIINPSLDYNPLLFTNKSLASRIMDILLDNAMKFTNQENGEISINYKEIKNYIEIIISDNGSGIKEDEKNLIFQRFYKGDLSHNEKGSGLGLAIAMDISICLEEKLWLSTTSSRGTSFSFTIQKP